MPKETAQFASTQHSTGTSIEVCWGKESSHVQLHVQRHAWKYEPFTSEGGLTGGTRVVHNDEGMPIRNITDPEDTEIWTDELTRDDINRMIRALRRARDQAYGRDE